MIIKETGHFDGDKSSSEFVAELVSELNDNLKAIREMAQIYGNTFGGRTDNDKKKFALT